MNPETSGYNHDSDQSRSLLENDIAKNPSAILKVAAYTNASFANILMGGYKEQVPPPAPAPRRPFLFKTQSPLRAEGDLGVLQSFPTEILVCIVKEMDLSAAFAFSNTCRFAKTLCSKIPEIEALSTHAHPTLMAYFKTKLASRVTINMLYDALTSYECYIGSEFCTKVIKSIFLPTCRRVCEHCVGSNDPVLLAYEVGVVVVSKLVKAINLSLTNNSKLNIPTFFTVAR